MVVTCDSSDIADHSLLYTDFILQCNTELLNHTEKAPDIRVTGEANSLAIEWSHDVCRFLLKWLPGLELKKPLKSSQVSTEGKSASAKQLGMYTECNLS